MRRFLFPLAAFLALVVLLGVGLRLKPAEVPSPLIGKPVPAFQLSQLQDGAKTISARDMAGRVWLLNVWASWCAACREEHPLLLQWARSHTVPVVGLNYKDGRADGIAWLRRFGDPYLVSAFDGDGRVGIDFGVYGVPETFVIDKRGVVRLKLIGGITLDAIEHKLNSLIRELESE